MLNSKHDKKAIAKALSIAKEWAKELGREEFKGHEPIIAEEVAHAFAEVDKGRNPDVVLAEALRRIAERIDECRSSGPTGVPNAGASSSLH